MTRSTRTWLAGSLILAAGCTDAGTPLTPRVKPAPEPVLQALDCSVDLREGAMACKGAEPGTGSALGAGGVILGGQNVFVRLASSNVSFVNGRLTLDVTVQNLIGQPLGTGDGVTAHSGGVRVWFNDGPTALPGGSATVVNADGEGILVSAPQPYFQYNTILAPNQVSAPRRWEMDYTAGAERISFSVYVVAVVQHENDTVEMASGYTFVLPGDTVRMKATVRDFTGRPRAGRVTWSSSDTTVATIDSTGLLRGIRRGGVYIRAATAHDHADAPAAVVTLDEATSLSVSPGADTLDMGERVQLSVQLYNLRGDPLGGPVGYGERNQWVAMVSMTGRVRATYPGTTVIHVGRDWVDSTVAITTRSGPEVTWKTVSTGHDYSCGVTLEGRGYCWGRNTGGQLGIGLYAAHGEWVPVAVAGEHAWSTIEAGLSVACGLDTDSAAWCWGQPWHGQLGNGTAGYNEAVTTPVPVSGGHRFQKISAGYEHVCALDLEGAAWCWGNNTYGQLGNDTTRVVMGEGTPVAVVGGLRFKEISATRDFTCAITVGDDLYCWGDNEVGQLGDGNGAPGLIVPHPVPVAGGLKWKAVAVDNSHACALTTGGRAYCWGEDQLGELGTGTGGTSSNVPVPVASALTFAHVGVGALHSCAITGGGTAYCWGDDYYGKLGRGKKESPLPHPTPEPAVGGVSFAGFIQGGMEHSCALGRDGKAYCWGSDFDGEAGVQPDTEFCKVPGGVASCQTRPRRVENPAPGGIRTGPLVGYSRLPGTPSPAPGSALRPRFSVSPRSR